jgi:3-phenylpropionate/trans-cinnamate dioxygenase ferredoxin component
MSAFVKVASLSELAAGGGRLCREVGDYYVVLIQIDQQVYCLEDVCTHDGGPLGEGELREGCLVCPRHGAKFDVRDGRAVSMPATEATRTFPVRMDGDNILIQVSG